MNMVLGQMGFSSPKEMDEAMRRYEAYCESLPENSSYPTFREFLGKPNMATETQKSIAAEMKGREFSNFSEVQSFMNSFMEEKNNKGLDDFEGISPAQMQAILSGKLEQVTWLLTLRKKLPNSMVEQTDVIEVMKWILQYHALQGGKVKLTEKENFPRKMCEAFLLQYEPFHEKGDPVPSEEKIPLLYTAHELLYFLAYLDESQTLSWITRSGIELFSSDRWSSLYSDALECILDYRRWAEDLLDEMDMELDDIEHFAIIQSAAPFLLYLLHRHPTGSMNDLFNRFCRAFPIYLTPADGGSDEAVLDFLQTVFERLFFFRFCHPFGLLDISPEREYSTTKLFRRAFEFTI